MANIVQMAGNRTRFRLQVVMERRRDEATGSLGGGGGGSAVSRPRSRGRAGTPQPAEPSALARLPDGVEGLLRVDLTAAALPTGKLSESIDPAEVERRQRHHHHHHDGHHGHNDNQSVGSSSVGSGSHLGGGGGGDPLGIRCKELTVAVKGLKPGSVYAAYFRSVAATAGPRSAERVDRRPPLTLLVTANTSQRSALAP